MADAAKTRGAHVEEGSWSGECETCENARPGLCVEVSAREKKEKGIGAGGGPHFCVRNFGGDTW